MAKSDNILTHGMSGQIGGVIVFRQVAGKTIVSKAPGAAKTESDKQREHRQKFQQAIIYAKAAIESPETGDLYREKAAGQKGKTAMNIAVADYFNAPNIEKVDLTGYTAHADDQIVITATDDFKVASVHVHITTAAGEEIESGEAVQVNGLMWIYTTVQNSDNPGGYRIVVTAYDLPGNTATEEVEWNH